MVRSMTNPNEKRWREDYRQFKSPIEKFQFLCGLKELSWEDCQDAWFESQKIMPDIAKSYEEAIDEVRRLRDALESAKGWVVTHVMQTYSKVASDEADDIEAIIAKADEFLRKVEGE